MNSFLLRGPNRYVRMTAARTTTTVVTAKIMFGSIVEILRVV
jgi:multisubunit Na+/H+ antiporter MnhG subunit